MNCYLIAWLTPRENANGRASVVVSYVKSRDIDNAKKLFVDYDHTEYGNAHHIHAIFKRLLSYHMGHDPDDETVRLFVNRPKCSTVVVTEADLNKFFRETDQQHSLRI